MYNHTCSVIPLWRVNNSVLFLYPWKEREKKIFLIRLEKSDMAENILTTKEILKISENNGS
jgi:hypothetical protein